MRFYQHPLFLAVSSTCLALALAACGQPKEASQGTADVAAPPTNDQAKKQAIELQQLAEDAVAAEQENAFSAPIKAASGN